MIRSMTGFGRASITSKLGKLSLEVSSINKRFLEVNISLPRNLMFFDQEIKKWINKNIFRGQLLLKFEFSPSEKNIVTLLPDISFLKNLKKGWEKLATDLGYSKDDISLEILIQQAKYLPEEKIKDITSFRKLIFDVLSIAVKNLIAMKIKEGKTLQVDIEKRIKLINKQLIFIKKKAPSAKKKYESKLKTKFRDLLEEESFEDKVLKEVALYAERIDITEEITRLESHINQLFNFIKLKQDVLGRKLEFLLQECLREANTITSKAQDADISKAVVEIKAEIEKIKEQLQNIE